MKRTIIWITILSMIILTLCSCDKSEPLYLIDSTMNVVDTEVSDDMLDAGDYGINTGLPDHVELEGVQAVRPALFNDNNEYQYKSSRCYPKTKGSEEYGSFYSIQDEYKGKDGTYIRYIHGTDILGLYRTFDDSADIYKGKGEPKDIADAFLKEILPLEALEPFTYVETIYNDLSDEYIVRYMRYIENFATDETIAVWMSRSGKVVAYNGVNVTKYDTLVDTIEEDSLVEAQKLLEEKIYSLGLVDVELDEPIITTNTSGELFLEIGFEYGKGIEYRQSAYIKIE